MLAEPRVRIQLCGQVTVEVAATRKETTLPGRQGRILLAYMVLRRHDPLPRDELSFALWGDQPPRAAESALAALLSKLRRTLAPVPIDGTRIVLPTDAWVDLEAAREAIHRAESALVRGADPVAWAAAQTSLFVARRPFLAGRRPAMDRRGSQRTSDHSPARIGGVRGCRAATRRDRVRDRRARFARTCRAGPVSRKRVPPLDVCVGGPWQRRRSDACLRLTNAATARRPRRAAVARQPGSARRPAHAIRLSRRGDCWAIDWPRSWVSSLRPGGVHGGIRVTGPPHLPAQRPRCERHPRRSKAGRAPFRQPLPSFGERSPTTLTAQVFAPLRFCVTTSTPTSVAAANAVERTLSSRQIGTRALVASPHTRLADEDLLVLDRDDDTARRIEGDQHLDVPRHQEHGRSKCRRGHGRQRNSEHHARVIAHQFDPVDRRQARRPGRKSTGVERRHHVFADRQGADEARG